MISSKLKQEITCPLCNQIFHIPLLLPCGHSVCSGCIAKLRRTSIKSSNITNNQIHYSTAHTILSNGIEDAVSEADSGVVVCSLESNTDCQLIGHSPQSVNRTHLCQELCRICSSTRSNGNSLQNASNFTNQHLENGNYDTLPSETLPHNIALENLITRLTKAEVNHCDKDTTVTKKENNSLSTIRCQLCESSNEISTLSFCEQCNLWYCKSCLNLWHPPTEMLIKHRISSFNSHSRLSFSIKQLIPEANGPTCLQHSGYTCNLFCITCSMFVCLRCLSSGEKNYINDNSHNNTNANNTIANTSNSYTSGSNFPHECSSHIGHAVCSTSIYAKKMKAEVSKLLHRLSEEAKRGAELVQSLKQTEDQLKNNISNTETLINQEIDMLIEALQEKRTRLIEKLHSDVQQRRHYIREQTAQAGSRLSSTTSLIYFGVELIKEREPSAFIQVAPSLKHRLINTENELIHETQVCREQCLGDFQLRMNTSNDILERIEAITLNEIYPPPIPKIILSQCLVESNSIQLLWDTVDASIPLKNDGNERCLMKESFPFLNNALDSNEINLGFDHTDNPNSSSIQWNSSQSLCCKDLYNPLSNSGLTMPTTVRLRPSCHIPESISAYALMTNSKEQEVNKDQYFHQSIQLYNHRYIPLPLSSNQYALTVPSTPELSGSFSANTLHKSMTINSGIRFLSSTNREELIHFQLEVDNGRGGPFKVAYTGSERVCRVEGLHLNTTYRFRIRSTNGIAHSAYSDIVAIKTARLASFVMNPLSGHSPPNTGLKVASDGCIISAQGDPEDRVLLGDIGFSKGTHYWEWNIEHYDGKGQPSFGIALAHVSKDKMLGQDEFGWAMYLNSKRSWFLHQGEHRDRTDGGIKITHQEVDNKVTSQNIKEITTTIGVRFDCERGHLAFYLNGEPHGPIAFTNLKTKQEDKSNQVRDDTKRLNLFYPAISLSHYTRVRLISGLEVPSESEDSSDGSEAEYDLSVSAPQFHFNSRGSKHSTTDHNGNNNEPDKRNTAAYSISTCLVRSTTAPCIGKPPSPNVLLKLPKKSMALPKLITFSRS
ncbi:E3 ubiquitin-protein ligase TRIM9 [Schistosoma japonicum]|uniref:E3 ubiquitin-protein ligase TRIM9 n=1 Tax=Schistosoma japonicum TaxID=6182 RepID=A0A4Z2D7J5_SCHJA|nr:E3 ubiquitin-protein ligase TRIM9 [Schistosoma japonicum]